MEDRRDRGVPSEKSVNPPFDPGGDMRRPRLSALGLAATTVLTVCATATTAHADPLKNSFQVVVTCGSERFTAVVAGNGEFAPAHDLSSTAMLVPVAFGETTFTVIQNGQVVDTETEPGSTKGSSVKNPNATTTCTYTGSMTEGDTTFTISGTVTGFVTPVG
jgi:hypothetical protein